MPDKIKATTHSEHFKKEGPTFTDVMNYFRGKEITEGEYRYYRRVLKDTMSKKDYSKFLRHLQQKPLSSVYIINE